MPTPGDIAQKMIAALRLTEPDLDTSIGTPVRKIFDAVSEQIAEAFVDQHLLTYAYDIDAKTDGDLDDFCALFGITRIPAQRAQGVVTFTRPTNAVSAQTAVVIAPGTQVLAQTNPLVYVQTMVSALMNPGQTTCDVPVQALTSGPAGNAPAGLLTTIVASIGTLSTVINANPLSGGLAQESDEQLRTRFKATVFRSLAGTQAMYEAVAQEIPQDPNLPNTKAVRHVNVLGSSKRQRMQVQVVSGTASVVIVNAAYIFPDNVFCGPNIDGGTFLTPGVNFSFTPSNPTTGADATASLASLSASAMPDGLYDLDFEYVPQASRNDPGNTRWGMGGINNRVDVWCTGDIVQTATQSVVFTSSKAFSSSPTATYYTADFVQNSDTATSPAAANIFIPLAFGPVLSLPDTISVGGVTYTEGTDYWIVHQNDAFGYSAQSLFGIAWRNTNKPAEGSVFSVAYTYNRVPRMVQDAIAQWRLVGTDARAHAGKKIYIRCNFAIMYDRRFDPTAVNTAINNALSAFFGGLGFDSALQASDVLQLVHNVPGVDNVRFLNSTDGANYAMQRMSALTPNTVVTTYQTSGRAVDIQFADDQYPIFHSAVIVAKASNTFGVG